jgi:hypothetical protein
VLFTIRVVVGEGRFGEMPAFVQLLARPAARAIWGRNFDGLYYRVKNPDVAAAGLSPAIHYLLVGFREAREPSPRFSGRAYLKANPDTAGWNPLAHYALHGSREGRQTFLPDDR